MTESQVFRGRSSDGDSDSIWREGNRITIVGPFTNASQGRFLCSLLYHALQRERHPNVVIDFSHCSGATQASLLSVLPQVDRYRQSSGINFRTILPEDPGLRRLFINTGWAHCLAPDSFEAGQDVSGNVSLRRYSSASEAAAVVNAVEGFIHKNMNMDRETLVALGWALYEITENVNTHAESEVGGFVQATRYQNRLEFVVSDGGMGIPASIGIFDHEEALREAVSFQRSRDLDDHAGNGLFGSMDAARMSLGEFEVHSQYASLFLRAGSVEPETRSFSIPLHGTFVRCGIGLGQPERLREGIWANAAWDYYEREFETDTGEFVYLVKKHADDAKGSREGGKQIRQELENILSTAPYVVVDFEGVEYVSSSFADEVFGRLFVKLEPMAFMSRVLFRNVNDTVTVLVNRAVMQRARLADPTRD